MAELAIPLQRQVVGDGISGAVSWEVGRCCSEEERHQLEMTEGVQGRSYHRWQAVVFGHLSEFLTQGRG